MTRVGRLILVRHGESLFNAENRFTGVRDPGLTPAGEAEALLVGRLLAVAGLQITHVFTSTMQRARNSAALIAAASGYPASAAVALATLDERDYGALTGLDKAAAVARWGAPQVRAWRRSYAEGPPAGESLRDVTARVARAYLHHLQPAALAGGTVLVVSHGNTLRALVGLLRDYEPRQVEQLEVPTGEVVAFDLTEDGRAHDSAVASSFKQGRGSRDEKEAGDAGLDGGRVGR